MGSPFITPVVDSASVFLPEIFNGRVVFVTGGGSGICREMTKAVVCLLSALIAFSVLRCDAIFRCVMEQMQP